MAQRKYKGPCNFRVGKWLPTDQTALENWLKKIIEECVGKDVDGIEDTDPDGKQESRYELVNLLPPIQELKDLIEDDPEVNMFFHQMFSQIPDDPQYETDPMGRPQVKNYRLMLLLLNHLLTRAPEYHPVELVAVPIHAVLTWPMATVGGYAAFLNDKVNRQFKKVLDSWGAYLMSEDSAYVLNEGETGWLGENAMAVMPDFKKMYKCDPSKPHWGFKSWDDFFARELKKGARPVASPNDDKVICNACESRPYAVQTNVRGRNRFWIKSQPYSMIYLLANDPLAKQFVGGTVYQAFLSAVSYHRWHSPVNGKIVKAYIQSGSYFSQAQSQGFTDVGTVNSQGYLAQVASRGLIFIEADNPYIGLMCFIAIGMAEVSTVDIKVYEGQKVKKGEELGTFHFGGSTHCLAFRPGVYLTFDLRGQEPGNVTDDLPNIPVRSLLATVPK